mmetsp:Transcript_17006/g.21688  ORF Transcript_17006/g.21688 Transcript_17006/m.21688 type:complete len:90 (-) Transcript_17006:73-342(-)
MHIDRTGVTQLQNQQKPTRYAPKPKKFFRLLSDLLLPIPETESLLNHRSQTFFSLTLENAEQHSSSCVSFKARRNENFTFFLEIMLYSP